MQAYELSRRRVGTEGVISYPMIPFEVGRIELLAGRGSRDAIVSVYGDATGSATPCLSFGRSRSGAHSTRSGSRSCPGRRVERRWQARAEAAGPRRRAR
jgi:hypothetical protein